MKRSPDSRNAYFHREVVQNRVQLQVHVEKKSQWRTLRKGAVLWENELF